MICQSCNQREANVHITKIINGVKTEMHLCDECAKKQDVNVGSAFNFSSPMSFQNILDGFFEIMGGVPKQIESIECPVCHMTIDDFRKTGRLGCGNCYKTFEEDVNPLIRRIHGNIQHTGKVPSRTGGELKIKRDIDVLRDNLKTAINNEEYEKAADIRDMIKELELKLKKDEK
jgi:protein arginine kinase activator